MERMGDDNETRRVTGRCGTMPLPWVCRACDLGAFFERIIEWDWPDAPLRNSDRPAALRSYLGAASDDRHGKRAAALASQH
jgi:hypothetical protein